MSDIVTVGHLINFSIMYVDANGNPPPQGTPDPTPDSPPVWTNAPSDPSVDTFVAAADGRTAILNALAVGNDTVGLTVIVGGVTYTASDLIAINPGPFALAGVVIVAQAQ